MKTSFKTFLLFTFLLSTFYLLFGSYAAFAQANQPGSGNCLEFDGVDDWVEVQDDASLDLITSFTIETWVKIDTNQSGMIVSKSAWCPDAALPFKGQSYWLGNTKNDIYLSVNRDGNYFHLRGTLTAVDAIEDNNQYHHISATFNNGTVEIIIDGTLIVTDSLYINTTGGPGTFCDNIGSCVEWCRADVTVGWCGYPATNYTGVLFVDQAYNGNEKVRIGSSWLYCGGNNNIASPFTGQIDEVRIWNYARSQTQIREDMCQKLAGSEPGLVGYWRFDEGTGITAFDSSPNGNDGSIQNGTLWDTSGAAIGDTSIYVYSANWTGTTLTLQHPGGADSLSVSNVNAAPQGVHIYRVDTVPNTGNGITGLGSNDRYFGVYIADTSATVADYSATYYYENNPHFSQDCRINMYERWSNAGSLWTNPAATNNLVMQTLSFTDTARGEYILGMNVALTVSTAFTPDFGSCDGSATATPAGGTPGYTYLWDAAANSQTTQIANSLCVGQYCVTVTDANGCTDTACVSVAVGMDEAGLTANDIRIYPNPSNGEFIIKIDDKETESIELRIVNVLGQEVFTEKMNQTNGTLRREIDLNRFAKGIYTLQLNINETIINKKMILK